MGFTRTGLRRFSLLMATTSVLLFVLGVANHRNGLIGDSSWTYIALATSGLAVLGAITNLVLSRAIDEEGNFVRQEAEPPTASIRRGFPLWLHLPVTALVALLFVAVGVGVSWWVAGIFLGPVLAIDLLGLLSLATLPLASKFNDVRRGRTSGGGGEGRV